MTFLPPLWCVPGIRELVGTILAGWIGLYESKNAQNSSMHSRNHEEFETAKRKWQGEGWLPLKLRRKAQAATEALLEPPRSLDCMSWTAGSHRSIAEGLWSCILAKSLCRQCGGRTGMPDGSTETIQRTSGLGSEKTWAPAGQQGREGLALWVSRNKNWWLPVQECE